MLLVPNPKNCDPSVKKSIQMLASAKLGNKARPVFAGLTLTSMTAGSILFAGTGGLISQDNSNLFWDDTNNRLGVGVNTGFDPRTGITISGDVDILHTATESDDHTFELDVDAAGYGDVKAIDIDYITGAISTGEDEGIILLNIDEIAATGGNVFGLEVLATEGAAGSTTTVYGLKAAALVAPIHQDSGTFVNPDIGTNDTPQTPVANMIDGNAANTTAIFLALDDYIIIGSDATFQEIEFILTTDSSGAGIKPKFEYSTGGSGFTEFSPVDGTNGFRNTGVVAWDMSDLVGHAINADTGGANTYDIKITRQRTNLTTPPVLGYAKVVATTEYIWDKDGNVNIKTLTISSIAAEGSDVDKFLVDSSGLIKYRTGAEILADIGGSVSAHLHDTQTLEHDGVDSDGGAFNFATTGDLTFQPATDGTTRYQWLDADGGTPILNIDSTNERVGIGIANPTADLHIGTGGDNAINIKMETNESSANTPIARIFGVWDGDTVTTIIFNSGQDTTNKDDGSIAFWTQPSGDSITERFRITEDGDVGVGEAAPETLLELTHAAPTITGHASTHSDADNSGLWKLVGKREDGAGAETESGSIEMSHDGVGANDQLTKMILKVNTGAGLVQALEIGSDLLATFAGSIISTNYTAAALLTACATNAGGLDFSAAGKTLTVEDDAVVNQDLTSDASPIFGGLTQVGDATNKLMVAADGELTLAGTARVKKYVIISAGGFHLGANLPLKRAEGTFGTLQFDNATTDVAYTNWHIPDDWAAGTDVEIAFYWAPTDGNAGNVAWEFDWEAVAPEANETLGAGSTNVQINDATQSLDNELLTTSYGTIAGASIAADDTIGIKISRDHDDGDTYGTNASFVHMKIKYIADKLGEST